MPIYEYVCKKCNKRFSLLQSIHATESDTQCPSCASKDVKKVVSTFSCYSDSSTDFSSIAPSGAGRGGT